MSEINEEENRTTRVFIMNAKTPKKERFFSAVTYFLYAVFALVIFAAIGVFGWYMEKLKFDYIYKDSVETIMKRGEK